jgi:glycosyltransferase involved in cell wall biosynthesis
VRVVFDVTPLSHPRTGVGNYLRGALAGLAEAAGPDDEVVAFAPTSPAGRRLVEQSVDGVPARHAFSTLPLAHAWRTAWSRSGWPPAERFLGGFDVLHFSDWMYPPQRSGLRATTIHDLVPLRFPEWTTGRTRRMHGAKYAHAARRCDLVFCNSEFTAHDVEERLAVPRSRLRVAHPGVGVEFSPDGPRADLGRPYVLTVATLEPRKNLATLVEAQSLLGDEFALALVGGEGWGERPELQREGVIPLGYVADEELPRLYRGAAAFAFPSRFEGFGMPVLEAIACGVPCAVSSHESLDEACGDAAVRADPESPEAFAAAIREAVERRDELVPRGLEHARRFTWRATGQALLDGYRSAL